MFTTVTLVIKTICFKTYYPSSIIHHPSIIYCRTLQILSISSGGRVCVNVWEPPGFLQTFSTWPPCIISAESPEEPMLELRWRSPAAFTGSKWGGWGGVVDVFNRCKNEIQTKSKTNISELKCGDEDTDEDVKRVWGDKSWRRFRCDVNKNMWSLQQNEYVTSHLCLLRHPSPELGGESASLFTCERQTAENPDPILKL